MALFYYKPSFRPYQKPCHKNLTQFWHKICHRPCTDCATNRYYQICICGDTISFYQWLWNTIRCLNTSPNKLFRWTYKKKFMFCFIFVHMSEWDVKWGKLSSCQFSKQKSSEKAQLSHKMHEMDGPTLYIFDGWLTILRDTKIASYL